MSNDHYATLGVDRTAETTQIRKAYRALALRWHPDKNPHAKAEAEEKFKAIAEAFEVLSSPDKRAAYDRGEGATANNQSSSEEEDYGQAGAGHFRNQHHFHQQHHGGHHPHQPHRSHFSRNHAFDVFRAFFGGQDPFAAMDAQMGNMGFGGSAFGGGMFGGSMFGGGMFGGGGGMGGMMDPFGMMNSMLGGGMGGHHHHHHQHHRAQTDPFGGLLSLSGGFGGGGGGMGSGMSMSSSTTRDSSGRTITQTTRTTIENGQSRTTTTTQIQHPDGRVETITDGGQSQRGALPSANSSRFEVPIKSASPPMAAAAAGNVDAPMSSPSTGSGSAGRRFSPIDLVADDEDDGDVQEIPAPPPRGKRSPKPVHTHERAASSSAAAATGRSPVTGHYAQAAPPQQQQQQQQQQPASPLSAFVQQQQQQQFSWQTATASPPSSSSSSSLHHQHHPQHQPLHQPQHHRSATAAAAPGYSSSGAKRTSPSSSSSSSSASSEARRREALLQRQRETDALVLEAQRSAARAATAASVAAAAASVAGNMANQAQAQAARPTTHSFSPSSATRNATAFPAYPSSSGTPSSSLYSSTSGVAPGAGGYGVSSSFNSSTVTGAGAVRNANPYGGPPLPSPISSVPRGVSGDLLNRRADTNFNELYSEYNKQQQQDPITTARRTKL